MTTVQESTSQSSDSVYSIGPRDWVSPEPHEGTSDDFSRLVEEYSDFAYRVAFRLLHNFHDVEDAVQDAFLSAYRAYPRFEGKSKFSTWLYRIVVNACLLRARKDTTSTKVLPLAEYDDSIVPDNHIGPESAAINGELREVLEAGLRSATTGRRLPVLLRDVHGLSNEEAAEVLGVSVPALKPESTDGQGWVA